MMTSKSSSAGCLPASHSSRRSINRIRSSSARLLCPFTFTLSLPHCLFNNFIVYIYVPHTHTHTGTDKATLSMRLTRLCLHHVCASSMWQTFLRTHEPARLRPSPPLQPLAPSLYLLMLLMKFLSFWRFLNFFRAQFACEFAAVCSPKNFVPFACCPSVPPVSLSSRRLCVRLSAILRLHARAFYCTTATWQLAARPSTPHDPLGYAAAAAPASPSSWSFRAVFLSFFMRR